MDRIASVVKRLNIYYINAYSKTVAGLLIAKAPYIIVTEKELSTGSKRLGDAIIEALRCFESGIPQPDFKKKKDVKGVDESLFGMKTYKEFMQNSLCIIVQDNFSIIELIATKNQGHREGFDYLDKIVEISSDSSPNDIGDAAIKAFNLCG